jgi:hypothetical protein
MKRLFNWRRVTSPSAMAALLVWGLLLLVFILVMMSKYK